MMNGLSIEDLLSCSRIGSAIVSPDETHVVYTASKPSLEHNKLITNIYAVALDRKTPASPSALTFGTDASSSEPQFVSQDQLFCLSTRSGHSRLYSVSLGLKHDGKTLVGSAAVELELNIPADSDVQAFRVSPDGKTLVFAMETSILETNAAASDEEKDMRGNGMLFDQLMVRHWDAFKHPEDKRVHLFSLGLEANDDGTLGVPPNAKPVDIMPGERYDVPQKPFGDKDDFVITPDSRSVVFCTYGVTTSEFAWSTKRDLFLVPVDASQKPVCLTPENQALIEGPSFSPDGAQLAFRSMRVAGYEADKLRVCLMDWNTAGISSTNKYRFLTEEWDRSASSACWSKDGKSLLVTAADVGQHSLFRIDLSTGAATPLVTEGKITAVNSTTNGLVFGQQHLKSPAELFFGNADGSNAGRLTHLNDDRLLKVALGDFEQFSFQGWNDETVHAYAVKPANFEDGKKYPVAFLIHGGPQGSFGNDFHYRWNPQIYSGAGYAAVMVDFHGSTGYGQKFCDSIGGDWGGKPFVDLQKGLQAALDRFSWMDEARVSALGASFGGYMINWIAGQMPDRFRCLVNHDGNLDERMAYFDTEELWFPERDHEGTPWENPESYEKHNPVHHVDKWKTPMLVIHGAKDYRVVDTQGLATFTALQRRGIPSKLLYFPEENHWVLKPRNSRQWHQTVIQWLDEWTKS